MEVVRSSVLEGFGGVACGGEGMARVDGIGAFLLCASTGASAVGASAMTQIEVVVAGSKRARG